TLQFGQARPYRPREGLAVFVLSSHGAVGGLSGGLGGGRKRRRQRIWREVSSVMGFAREAGQESICPSEREKFLHWSSLKVHRIACVSSVRTNKENCLARGWETG